MLSLRPLNKLLELTTEMAMGLIQRRAKCKVSAGEVKAEVKKGLKVALLVPLLILALTPLSYVFALLAIASLYPSLKVLAAQAASRVLRRKMLAEKYSPLVIDELRVAYLATGSLERAVSFVAEGNYPEVSEKLRSMVKRTEEGRDVARELLRYASLEAPPSLRDFIPRFLRKPSQCTAPPGLYRKLWELYLEDVKKLRMNALIILSVGFLLPIPTTLAFLLSGHVFTPPLLIPAYAIAMALMVRASAVRTPEPMG
ncbi:MAG: hypothetical protein DRN00_04540 [Thermoplasmata archaeon]|nr:MAG: hypothetical protein DRN00_04540 [Thermoplasmata archaeon]